MKSDSEKHTELALRAVDLQHKLEEPAPPRSDIVAQIQRVFDEMELNIVMTRIDILGRIIELESASNPAA